MPERYAAFLSYAHRYGDWVQVFHGHLEASLEVLGCSPYEVFLDQVDLASGRSLVGRLQEGLSRADHLILIATPEALASPRVEDEWDSFIADRRDWAAGHLHVALLVDVPLPPFLERLEWVDFREHDEVKYRKGLREILGGLLGQRDRRNLPALPDGIDAPAPPDPGIPPELRRKLVDWLAEVLRSRAYRRLVTTALGFQPTSLDSYAGWDCAASAALVHATGDDDPVTAGLRIVRLLAEEFAEDEPEKAADLGPLRDDLAKLQAEGPEKGLLRTWLRSVEADHQSLVPYFRAGADLTLLDRVYVRLDLHPSSLRTRPEKDPEAQLGGPRTLRDLLELSPADHPWITRRWTVLGDPGAGKTTLVRHLAATLARETAPRWVPVLESLPRLLRDGAWLLDRIGRRLERSGHPARGLPAVLDQAGREGRLLVLLDGLDEVPREDREDAERLLRDLALRWPETPLVVTSRPIGYRPPDGGFVELELLALDRPRRRAFLARWFGRGEGREEPERAAEALAALTGDPTLEELSGNPLYLTLMALLLEKGTSPSRHRTRLYDQIFDLLLAGKHKPEPQEIEDRQTVRRVLAHLAYAMTEDNRDAEASEALEARLYQEAMEPLTAELGRVPRWHRSLQPFLKDVAEMTGILGPYDGPEADWRFWHRTFREALAAERLEEIWGEGGEGEDALLAHASSIEGDLGRWAEPYALLTGRVSDPDALVKTLVGANRPLGLRALATAQGLSEATLEEVLELTGDWEERSEVYPRIPELVGEGDRALHLLDRLRRGTRDGNDLFFLDLAVSEAGRRYPGEARAAEALRGRLFDHIPAPPEDLFQWVETPRDGRVELWPEVPAGTFWMGRPKGEKGREDELPRHEVEIAAPFRIGAVLVTNAQYRAFDPSHEWRAWEGVSAEELAHHPVVHVTWYAAVSFCRWLSAAVPGLAGARLPTEEEWEYACRAGTETAYWKGPREEDLAAVGWYAKNSGNRTHRVGEKPGNPWGLYDVHGNVWEWTLSRGLADYRDRLEEGPHDPREIDVDGEVGDDPGGERRVFRGGSFWFSADRARSAYRGHWDPGDGWNVQGFRVVVPVAPSS